MASGMWKANSDGSAFWESGEDQNQDPSQPQTQTQPKASTTAWNTGQPVTNKYGNEWGQPSQTAPKTYAPDDYSMDAVQSRGGNTGVYDTSKLGGIMMNQADPAQAPVNVGHDGVYNGMNREQWRDAWMSSGQMTQDQMRDKLTSMGATNAGRGDYWTTPHGETYDLGIGFKTGNPTAGWTPVPGPGSAGASAAPGGFSTQGWFGRGGAQTGYGGGADGTLPGGGGGGNFTPGGGRGDYLWNILAGRAGMNEVPSAKDPVIAAQVNSFRAEQERAARNNLDQAAESQGPNSNLNLERRMGNEAVARATGGLQAQVMANELTQRRGMIQNALSQMGGMLSDDQKLALQRELGLIEASLSQQRINSGNDQFMAELGLRAEDQANRWDWTRSGGTF